MNVTHSENPRKAAPSRAFRLWRHCAPRRFACHDSCGVKVGIIFVKSKSFAGYISLAYVFWDVAIQENIAALQENCMALQEKRMMH